MLLMFLSFLLILLSSQRKKFKYQKEVQLLRESQQNQLIEAAVRSEEIERHRIAETLHDEVGAILSSAKLHLQAIKPDQLNERDKEMHEKGRDLLDEGINKVRGISHNLHSSILKEFGLNEAIRHFMKMISKGTILTVNTELDDNYKTANPENDISIYRMIQELVNNILKHGKASEIVIGSAFAGDLLEININHNGYGLTQEQFEKMRYNKEGLGLKNIQNRVILLRGEIAFSAGADGSNVNIKIPTQITGQ